jgi:RNA polymerase sigma factor (sigma-70 family)
MTELRRVGGRYVRGPWPERTELVRLVRAAQRGDAGALDALLAALRPAFVAVFARRTAHDAAEDLSQAALIRVVRELAEIDPDRAGRYVSLVVRTFAQAEGQRLARALRQTAPGKLARKVASPFDIQHEIEYEELVDAVRRVSADRLPPELAAVVLGVLGGFSPEEIAASIGSKPVTIRSSLRRARMMLRRELASYIDEGRAVAG